MLTLGSFFYRYRSLLPIPFFLLIFYFGHLTAAGLLYGSIIIGLGLFFRIWASGYTQQENRLNRFFAAKLITDGPYRFTRHPLYLGNFFLTLGVLFLYAPGLILILIIIALFLFEYCSIIIAEENFLAKRLGPQYEEYRKSVPALFKFRVDKFNPAPAEQKISFTGLSREISTILLVAAAYLLIIFKLSLINLLK